MIMIQTRKHIRRTVIALAITIVTNACGVLQPPDASGPRSTEPPYPVFLNEDVHRREVSLVTFNQLSQQAGGAKSEVRLQPITATIESLPNQSKAFYLPKVGLNATMKEEETRESLRRFINDWRGLIGADPSQLSLVESSDQPDGTKLAIYEQRPFRYPVRGEYGKLQIRFTTDRRILNLSSSAIPEADRVQTALAAVAVRQKWEDVLKQLRDSPIAYTDAAGQTVSYKLPSESAPKASQLVIYILPSKTSKEALEFHVAWEIEFNNAPLTFAYIDAITGDFLGAR